MKRLLALFTALLLLLCMVACSDNREEQTSGTSAGTTTAATTASAPTVASACQTLNTLAEKSYSSVRLEVTTLAGGAELTATYETTATEVRYTVEKLSLFPEDGNIALLPESFLSTVSGTATVENGVITAINGDAVSLPASDTLNGKFTFAEANFTNATSDIGSFSADIKNTSAFMGVSGIGNAKLSVTYTAEALSSVTITYTTAQAEVTMVYTFA